MAWQQSDLDALDAAMRSPVKKIVFADGRSVENYDLDQLRRLRAEVKAELAAEASRITPRRRFSIGQMRRSR